MYNIIGAEATPCVRLADSIAVRYGTIGETVGSATPAVADELGKGNFKEPAFGQHFAGALLCDFP